MNFKFQIGDAVCALLHLEEIEKLLAATTHTVRPDGLRVEERISIECVGGTQLFYGCRNRDGQVLKFNEASLVPAEMMWRVWLDGIHQQEAKKEKLNG
jgi:hypothetical protein